MSQYYIKFYNFTGQAIHPLCKRYAVILESRVQFLKFRLLIELLIRFYFNQFTTKAFSTFPLQYFSLSLNLFYLALEDGSPLFQQVYSHCTYYLLLATASSCSQQKQLQDFFYLLWQVTDDFTRATSILACVCLADVRQADVCLASIANIGFSDFTHRYFQSLG